MEPHKEITDFEFLFEFENLVGFTMHRHDLDDWFVRRLFDHFESFEINYRINKDNVKIKRIKKGAEFEFSVFSGHSEIFEQLDDLLLHLELEIRNPVDENHECDCSCEFFKCYRESYASNYSKTR